MSTRPGGCDSFRTRFETVPAVRVVAQSSAAEPLKPVNTPARHRRQRRKRSSDQLFVAFVNFCEHPAWWPVIHFELGLAAMQCRRTTKAVNTSARHRRQRRKRSSDQLFVAFVNFCDQPAWWPVIHFERCSSRGQGFRTTKTVNSSAVTEGNEETKFRPLFVAFVNFCDHPAWWPVFHFELGLSQQAPVPPNHQNP